MSNVCEMKIWIFIFVLFRYDFVIIYDGGSLFDSELARLTGIFPDDVISTGTELYINFISDESETTLGFKIQFDAGKNEYFKYSYKPNVFFRYIIISSKVVYCS